jgi:hypothetical protein
MMDRRLTIHKVSFTIFNTSAPTPTPISTPTTQPLIKVGEREGEKNLASGKTHQNKRVSNPKLGI